MRIGINPKPYDIGKARTDKKYAGAFTSGWQTADIKRSSEFEKIITTMVWSPIVFNDSGYRCSENYVEARLLALDFDTPDYTLAQCINEWCDTIHWIGITKTHRLMKHGIACDRFRLVVPYERVISDAREYNYNYRELLRRYPAGDPQTKDLARLFFPCREIVSVQLEGEQQPVVPLPPSLYPKPRDYSAYRRHRSMPHWVTGFLKFGCPPRTRNTTCFKLGVHLTRCGFSVDEIVKMIMASPIPIGPAVEGEVAAAVASGAKRGIEEIENECREKEDESTTERS